MSGDARQGEEARGAGCARVWRVVGVCVCVCVACVVCVRARSSVCVRESERGRERVSVSVLSCFNTSGAVAVYACLVYRFLRRTRGRGGV